MIYNTGINDFFKYRTRCPNYWANQNEQNFWEAGQRKAKESIL